MKIEERIVGLDHAVTTGRYASWHFDELELRSFLLTSAKGMTAWFKSKEEEAEREGRKSFDRDTYPGLAAYNSFMDETGIFWEQYWQQLSAAVIKDAFTLFEVFLEESAHDLLRRYGSGLKKLSTEGTWLLHQCNSFYEDYVGVTITTPEIENIQWIRNKLSHLRNSFRTVEGKNEFADKVTALGIRGIESSDEEGWGLPNQDHDANSLMTGSLVLSPLESWRILDILRKNVEALTLVLHGIQYGSKTTPALDDLRAGKTVEKKRDEKLLSVPVP
ncbi:hypothetical protein NG697_12500 [Pseudarthrobacter sp. MDT3-26]|uniref:hypothetical protein n=1 Tax=Pseudarthrobacter raffinosi TaxID=2953651 RepID=UPI00208DF5A8|nr:hypothetical protein [Pseudarthrobacter sp. MDT3-26]MCO4263732.1 hypothetical protein [Pseudarthrobacter sp. MDT3-26]